MNRKKFDSLPAAAQALIRKYSGERAAAAWIDGFDAVEQKALDKIKTDATQRVVEPSTADRSAAQAVYKSLTEAWADKSQRNRQLLKTIETDIATIRSTAR